MVSFGSDNKFYISRIQCHRNPEPHLRPRDQITNMEWDIEVDGKAYDANKDPTRTREVLPPEHCSGCHR